MQCCYVKPRVKTCLVCKVEFATIAPNGKYCPKCKPGVVKRQTQQANHKQSQLRKAARQ